MKNQQLTGKLQDLCHAGYSQLEVVILDDKMQEHLVKDVIISPNKKVWIKVEGNGKEKSDYEN